MNLIKEFNQKGDFSASDAAVSFLVANGFSVGRMQAHSPRGILFGQFDIQKWRNLSKADRDALDGVMIGNDRDGPIVVRIYDSTPLAVRAEFAAAAAECEAAAS